MGMGDKSHEGLTLQLVDLTVIFSPPTGLIKTLLRAFLHSLSLITYFCKSPCNRTQPSCWMLHVASVCTQCCMLLRFVANCCAKFETGQIFSYMQTDEITLNTVGQQFWELLRPFARSFRISFPFFSREKIGCSRLSFTFTSNGNREFVPRDNGSPLLVVYCSLFLHINQQFHTIFYL